ncbi:iron complex transport system ATP-binding protein [Sphingobium sp. OAS761]|uniref:ABC transporter ATP-binding protein n=1 Tax=Sphingobium sp. OAS761 TaxID=2817901 RepID=UPI00209FA716|nr:ABC transporter ATP-binding protein [Sphingobium sp. OAS761]MCP1471064.1 iron complex transport system ATP-binding protein [Sphingobium sp. OAS761]
MVTIRLDGVSARIGRRDVLHDISGLIAPGRLVGIIGPNGAGKSTLMRSILGLVPLSGGAITFDDRPIRQLSTRQIAQTIAYLPQGHMLHWPLSVTRLVTLGRLPHLGPLARPGARDMAAVKAAMHRADIGHLADRAATELSGGERARVMLARALAAEAPALAVDEPLASLDPGHQIDVMELLAAEARSGALVLAVLHDLTMAARYCDRLLLLDKGRLVADGSVNDVLREDRLRAVYGVTSHIDLTSQRPLVVPTARWTEGR